MQIENWEQPFPQLEAFTLLHLPLNAEEVEELTSCCRNRWAGTKKKEDRKAEFNVASSFYPESPVSEFKFVKRQEAWPRVDNSGGGYFCKTASAVQTRGVSVRFPVGCFVRCEQINVPLCVKMNCLCFAVRTPTQGRTKKLLGQERRLITLTPRAFRYCSTFRTWVAAADSTSVLVW